MECPVVRCTRLLRRREIKSEWRRVEEHTEERPHLEHVPRDVVCCLGRQLIAAGT